MKNSLLDQHAEIGVEVLREEPPCQIIDLDLIQAPLNLLTIHRLQLQY